MVGGECWVVAGFLLLTGFTCFIAFMHFLRLHACLYVGLPFLHDFLLHVFCMIFCVFFYLCICVFVFCICLAVFVNLCYCWCYFWNLL